MFDSRMMASFVKEARMIQTVDADMPPGHLEVKAAMSSLYGINKYANLLPGKAVASAATRLGKVAPSAAKGLAVGSVAPATKGLSVNGMQIPHGRFIPAPAQAAAPAVASGPKPIVKGLPQTPFKPADPRFALRDHVDPFGGTAFRVKVAALLRKAASIGAHAAELAGLGILAKPSIDEMRGKHVDERKKAKMEVAGLGVLAAPSAHELAKSTSQTYRSALSRAGSVFKRAPTQALTHLHG